MTDRAVHFFREHNTEADFFAGNGVKGREEEWSDTADVTRSEVASIGKKVCT